MEDKIIQIENLAFGGEGVGRCDGKVVFVPWTVPGDRVRVRPLSDHGKYERAEVVELLEGSPDRIVPLCPVFGSCGGCQWQQMVYEAQVRWKGEILAETIRRVGRIPEPKVLPVIPAAEPWNYRRRIQLKVTEDGRIGFHAYHSHDVISFDDCKIADPLLNEKLASLRGDTQRPTGPFELSLNGSGVVCVREGSEPGVFSQVHSVQNERLVETMLDFAFGNAEIAFTKKRRVVELYAGSGNMSFPLAERAGWISCVEENSEAVRRGEEAADVRGIKNMEWILGSAEWGLKKIYRGKTPVDLLVLDPPRRGAKEVLDLVCVIRPRVIVYVSCDPVTLARDLNLLVRRYYRLEKVQPIDMFPQTYHIESVSKLVLIY